MDEIFSYYWASTMLMAEVKYDSLVNKIPIVFLTERDISKLLLIEQENLTDLRNVKVVRIDKYKPYSPDNIRLEIK